MNLLPMLLIFLLFSLPKHRVYNRKSHTAFPLLPCQGKTWQPQRRLPSTNHTGWREGLAPPRRQEGQITLNTIP
ncbi:hypothetical protein BKA67DRAFT_6256 [Truncatella angustata]|uniref:Secreted protein n=1 Tax=Truncatella angustata TaxID=152316 RepID=A0A9P8UW25_9PEZI|nr:uncharacterized protein BKA67DRAFT_6256 [Truncatella angustata]KAH6659106.1 hypothetical protein BKA67DRAFT_6256 [Truncatella angustata]